jgi:DnaJ-class molecular chaperone
MALVSITCSNCDGEGLITAEASLVPEYLLRKVTCNECDGAGSHLVHTGSIHVGLGIGEREGDSSWATVWERQDNDVIELVDFYEVSQQNHVFTRIR